MTPEELKHVVFNIYSHSHAFDDLGALEVLMDAIKQARSEALEEAARAVENEDLTVPQWHRAQCAAAIRALNT